MEPRQPLRGVRCGSGARPARLGQGLGLGQGFGLGGAKPARCGSGGALQRCAASIARRSSPAVATSGVRVPASTPNAREVHAIPRVVTPLTRCAPRCAIWVRPPGGRKPRTSPHRRTFPYSSSSAHGGSTSGSPTRARTRTLTLTLTLTPTRPRNRTRTRTRTRTRNRNRNRNRNRTRTRTRSLTLTLTLSRWRATRPRSTRCCC